MDAVSAARGVQGLHLQAGALAEVLEEVEAGDSASGVVPRHGPMSDWEEADCHAAGIFSGIQDGDGLMTPQLQLLSGARNRSSAFCVTRRGRSRKNWNKLTRGFKSSKLKVDKREVIYEDCSIGDRT